MLNILFLKNKRFFCSCEKLEDMIKITKIGEEENIIDLENFLDYDYFKKVIVYGEQLLSVLNYDEWFSKNIILGKEEKERVINIFGNMCKEIGFIICNNVNLNGHKRITLDINDIKKICIKIIKIYLIYNVYVSKNEKNVLLKKFNIKILNEFNINNEYTKLEVTKYKNLDLEIDVNEYFGLLLSSYDLYVLFIYVILERYIYQKKENYENKIFCSNCKKEIKVTDGNVRNTKMCKKCRDKENKKNRDESRQKRKIINNLVGYKDIVTNINNFDMEEFNIFINSMTNKKKDVEKKNLKELKDYLRNVEKIIKEER